MMTADTKRHIDAARDVLVGKVPDPKSQVQEITNALIYKFMDDMDEKAASMGGKRLYFTDEYEKYGWRKIMDPKVGAYERIGLYTEALSRLAKNPNLPELFRTILQKAFLPFNDGRTLTLFLNEINYFDYRHHEELGDAYEYLLSIMGSQGDAGQFRTPRHIIDFIVNVVDPTKDDTVLDPACGTAGFLISAYKHVLSKHDGKDDPKKTEKPLTADEKRKLHSNYTGFDIDDNMVKMALVNMYLHGFPKPTILVHDTLSSEDYWNDRYDVIMANPPFMSPRGGIVPHSKFSIQSTRSEVLFVDYIMSHLKPSGRAGIIVPEGIIFQSSNAHKQLRKKLIEDGLYAVVSLPSGVFNPYAGVKTSILFFDNDRAKQLSEILFIKITKEGYDLGAQRRPLCNDNNDNPEWCPKHSDFPEALEALKKWKESVKTENTLALYVQREKITDSGDYNLSVDRYHINTHSDSTVWPFYKLSTLESENKIEFLRGQGISKRDLSKNGKYKCIHYGEIYTLYDPIIKNVVSKTDIKGKITSEIGDVLVPATTTADALGISVARSINEAGVIIGGDINIIRTRNKSILSDYLAQIISNPPLKVELSRYAKGINILHLSINDLRRLRIPLPPLEIQQQIVAELDGYQNIITGARQIVDNWKPVILIDSSWKWLPVENIAKADKNSIKAGPFGSSIKKEMYVNKGYKVYGQEQVIRNDINYGDYYIDLPTFNKLKSCAIEAGDILISLVGTFGKLLVVPDKFEPGIINPRLMKITLDQKKCLPMYFKYMFQTDQIKKQIDNMSYGGTMGILNTKILRNMKFPTPPVDVQKHIVEAIEVEQKIVDVNKKLIGMYEQRTKNVIAKLWGE